MAYLGALVLLISVWGLWLIRRKKLATSRVFLWVAIWSAVLGRAQLGLHQYSDAQKSADEACSLQPEGRLNAEGRMLSGEIQTAQGNYEEAAKIFQSISVIIDDPQLTPRAMEKAYKAWTKAGNAAEAAKVLNALQTRYPEHQITPEQP